MKRKTHSNLQLNMDEFSALAFHLDLRERVHLAFLCKSHMENPSIFITKEEASLAIIKIAEDVCKEKDCTFCMLGTLIKAGAVVDRVDDKQMTALMYSAKNGHDQVCRSQS